MSIKVSEKKWTKEEILNRIATDDKWLYRGILAIYNKQTQEEKYVRDTVSHNGVGFSGVHAKTMSYYASYIQRTGKLTGEHYDKAKEIMAKYAGQLTKIANGKI